MGARAIAERKFRPSRSCCHALRHGLSPFRPPNLRFAKLTNGLSGGKITVFSLVAAVLR